MKTIVVKVYDSKEAVKEIQVVTKDGKPTVIKAGQGVNYDFFDESIGHAPNHIVNKRIENDLHVSFEREGEDTDLVIENFYDNEDQALIGIAEDGEYYYYIPDTGEVYDYVTQLQTGDIEGHALGGKNVDAATWTATAGGVPLWLGILGLGLAAVPFLLKKDKEDEDDKADKDDPVIVDSEAPIAKDRTESVYVAGKKVVIGLKCCVSDVDGDQDLGSAKLIDPATKEKVTELVVAGEGKWVVNADKENITFTPEDGFKGDPSAVEYVVSDKAGNESQPAKIDLLAATTDDNSVAAGIISLEDATIDISAIDTKKDYTKFDLDNDVTQEMSISLENVLDLTDNANTLFIDGDAEDIIKAEGFTLSADSNQVDYNQYTGTVGDNIVTLYIDTEITNVVI